jgi:hypothetical protein
LGSKGTNKLRDTGVFARKIARKSGQSGQGHFGQNHQAYLAFPGNNIIIKIILFLLLYYWAFMAHRNSILTILTVTIVTV